MPLLHNIWGIVLLWTCVGGLIVPIELPQALYNFVYPYIPIIKKGTDSRVGIGFRFGEHADFQVLFELGPQTEAVPIGPNAGDSKRRRQVSKPTTYVATQPVQAGDIVADIPRGKWLSSWRSLLINTTPAKPEKPRILGHQKAHDYIVSHLSKLYRSAETMTETTTLRNLTTTTSATQQENL